MKLNLQFFGGRGSGGGRRQESSLGSEATQTAAETIAKPANATVTKATESKPKTANKTFTTKSTWEEINKAIGYPKEGDKLVFTKLDGTKETYTYKREDRVDYLDRTERSGGGYGRAYDRYVAEEWVSNKGHTEPREDMARYISIFTTPTRGFQQRYKKVVYKKA